MHVNSGLAVTVAGPITSDCRQFFVYGDNHCDRYELYAHTAVPRSTPCDSKMNSFRPESSVVRPWPCELRP